jgi:hypothetical protein
MAHCFRCNAFDVVKDEDHKPWCPVIKQKRENQRRINNLTSGYRKNDSPDAGSHGNINRPGTCKKCGVVVSNLLTHLGKCKPAEPPAPPEEKAP